MHNLCMMMMINIILMVVVMVMVMVVVVVMVENMIVIRWYIACLIQFISNMILIQIVVE